jgi:hypothetical protein
VLGMLDEVHFCVYVLVLGAGAGEVSLFRC